MRRPSSLAAAQTFLRERCGLELPADPQRLAACLRGADLEWRTTAEMLDQQAEHARTRAQQARDLLAALVNEGQVSP